MFEFAEFFYLTRLDFALLISCPVIAGCASFIRILIAETDIRRLPALKKIPADESEQRNKQPKENRDQRIYSIIVAFLAGAAVGLGIALLFFGAIQPQASAVGRVWFLSLLSGFAAPTVLLSVRLRVERTLKQENQKTEI